MTLATQMVTDVSTVFLNTSEHAETVYYTPVNGAKTTLTAIVDPTEDVQVQEYPDGKQRVRRRTLYVASASVPNLQEGDGWTVTNLDYKTEMGRPDQGGMHEVMVVRFEAIEKSAENYRIPRR